MLQLVIAVLVAGIVGVLAAVWPSRRAARLDVLRAIASESSRPTARQRLSRVACGCAGHRAVDRARCGRAATAGRRARRAWGRGPRQRTGTGQDDRARHPAHAAPGRLRRAGPQRRALPPERRLQPTRRELPRSERTAQPGDQLGRLPRLPQRRGGPRRPPARRQGRGRPPRLPPGRQRPGPRGRYDAPAARDRSRQGRTGVRHQRRRPPAQAGGVHHPDDHRPGPAGR